MLTMITGVGAKGQVGEAVARTLAVRGHRVLLVSRGADDVLARTRELVADGFDAHGYATDLADANAVEQLAARVKAEHGDRLDALVNLAGGFAVTGPIAEADPSALERMLRVNLTTAYLATRAFYSSLVRARGSIVYFASEAVLEGTRTSGISAYVAAKTAVVALMRSVADEGREHGVRANALAPAAMRTGANVASMGPGARYVELEDVGAAVAFLCSSEARAISSQIMRLRPSG
jgi:NAD(P)-dependent dehydrogenase (short-subunit alcohol dehydrogenase family)